MKYVKLFSALAIIMAVAMAPASTVFAQSDVNADVNADVSVNANTAETKDKQIYKEQKQVRDQIKEQRQNIKTQLNDLRDLRNDRLAEKTDVNVVPSLEFSGKVTGWAVIGGKAVPATFDLSGEAGKIGQRGWKISGTADAEIGDRNVTFDLQGFARGNHVVLKGTTSEFDSVVVHLNGYFAPIADESGSFALAFHRSAIINEQANIRIPLVLVGQVDTTLIGDVVEPTEIDPVDVSVELSALFN
ncbi:hypothetical protein [Candidatus Nitrosarchaeum limnium]|uniref:Uncharacterized protein n=1 Tax=Candidatus Nitrosarchaeum limnium BG20 TaxID=859192 RepID=S2DZZ4_9ARCH|nr:hypothetical protein [Candidatus Nitrosarchaeum limnium]EPA04253.1 hypothetical protein BG20_I2121 [Candidatus Nitrosarchaeum limnium BG20]